MPMLIQRDLRSGLPAVEFADGDRARDVEAETDYARIVAIGGERLSKAEPGGLHLDLHFVGGVPPVVAMKLWHLRHRVCARPRPDIVWLAQKGLHRNLSFEPSSFKALFNFFDIGRFAVPSRNSSMKLTPLPFTVVGDDDRGLAGPALAFSRASTTCRISWPSMVITSQPKLRYFSSSGSTFITSFTQPSICRRLRSTMPTRLSRLNARLHRCLPDLAFLLFAVAHDAEIMVIFFVAAAGKRDAYGDAQALAERSSGDFNAWQFEPMRMAPG